MSDFVTINEALESNYFASLQIKGVDPRNGQHIEFPPLCICCGESVGGRGVETWSGGSLSENFGSLTVTRRYGVRYRVGACEFCKGHFRSYDGLKLRRAALRFVAFFGPLLGIAALISRVTEPEHTLWYAISGWVGWLSCASGAAAIAALHFLGRRWAKDSAALSSACTSGVTPFNVLYDPKLSGVHSLQNEDQALSTLQIFGHREHRKYVEEVRRRNSRRVAAAPFTPPVGESR